MGKIRDWFNSGCLDFTKPDPVIIPSKGESLAAVLGDEADVYDSEYLKRHELVGGDIVKPNWFGNLENCYNASAINTRSSIVRVW